MRLFPRRSLDMATFDLLEEAGRNLIATSSLLRDLLHDYPERSDLAADVTRCEHEGDRITHDIIHRMNGGGAGRAPFDPVDGHSLATALDDVVDYAEEVADSLSLYAVEAPMEQATALADVLVGATERVSHALTALRDGADLTPDLVEINRLENEGDRISRDAVASLFATGIDPMVVIRWKDIFGVLEEAIDATEKAAQILEGIVIKNS